MTTTLEEYQSTNPAASASGTIPLTTSLLSSDLVLVIYSRTSSGAGSVTIDGGTFSVHNTYLNSTTRVQVSTVTGLTGSHTISYTMTSGSNMLAVYVVRGLSTSAITAEGSTPWPGASTASNTDYGPSPVSIDDGQMIIAIGAATGAGSIVFPSNPTPSTGWTTDSTGGSRTRLVHRIFTASGTAQVNIQCSTSGATLAVAMLVLGSSGAPVAAFSGWGYPIF